MTAAPPGFQRVRVWTGPFAGAWMLLTAGHSKRKRLGIYEHELNPWLHQALRAVEVVWDVGANDGYFTYGAAHALKRHRGSGTVIAFEPGLAQSTVLTIPSAWPCHAGIKFDFDPHAVGTEHGMVTLERAAAERRLEKPPGLFKIDVEGGEIEVLSSAGGLLGQPHQWVVEVHGHERRKPVQELFRSAGREIDTIEVRPHWLFGPEQRTLPICWVVTRS